MQYAKTLRVTWPMNLQLAYRKDDTGDTTSSGYCWSALRAKYAFVDDVGLYVVGRPSVVCLLMYVSWSYLEDYAR